MSKAFDFCSEFSFCSSHLEVKITLDAINKGLFEFRKVIQLNPSCQFLLDESIIEVGSLLLKRVDFKMMSALSKIKRTFIENNQKYIVHACCIHFESLKYKW